MDPENNVRGEYDVSEHETELSFLRKLLFSDANPTSVSIVNALRHAVDAVEESRRVRNGSYIASLEELCSRLEVENSALRSRLVELEKSKGMKEPSHA